MIGETPNQNQTWAYHRGGGGVHEEEEMVEEEEDLVCIYR